MAAHLQLVKAEQEVRLVSSFDTSEEGFKIISVIVFGSQSYVLIFNFVIH